MEYRTFGRTGIKVSEVGFGAWAIGGPASAGERQIGWGEVNDETSVRALEAAFGAGVTLFDTADAYGWGHSEALIGKTFEGRRDQIVISSKVGNRILPDGQWVKDFSPAWVHEAVEGSLKRLRTDYIDIYHLHSPMPDFIYTDEIIDGLDSLKREGKIRSYGVSIIAPGRGIPPSEQGLAVIRTGKCDFIQVVYHMLDQVIAADLLPACREANVGVIARVPLASGFLAGKYTADTRFPENDHRSKSYPPERIRETVARVEQLRFLTENKSKTMAQAAIQFCLCHPAVSAVIPGAKTPEQARDNAAASDGVLLSKEELARIRSVLEE